eukprot:5505482-Prymnesium_polylepis.1
MVSSSPLSMSRSAYSVCAPSAAFQLQWRFCARMGPERVRSGMAQSYSDPGFEPQSGYGAAGVIQPRVVGEAVSYTHLTLPTICSV